MSDKIDYVPTADQLRDELRSIRDELRTDEEHDEDMSLLLLGPISRNGLILAITSLLKDGSQ